MKVLFMGTPAFSVPVLDALYARHQVVAAYCQPPRPAGRGKKDRASPVQIRAEELGVPVRCPVSLRDAQVQADMAAWQAEMAVVVAYGLILPPAVLRIPARGCLNIHASLLPRWRGAAPIHRAILAGDAETGVCIMNMNEGLDTGPVLLRQPTPIGLLETTGDLQDRLSTIGAALILAALAGLGGLIPQPQAEQGVSYANKIDKAEARVDWTQPAQAVDRQIRGLSPFPGAWCEVAGERVKLMRSRLAPGSGAPGQRLTGLVVACGRDAVEVLEAQRQGKRVLPVAELLRGWDLPVVMS